VADADRVIQTLTNLIGNAVKFSPAGSTVEVMAERRGGEVLFRVSDRGRGIPVDKLETIFERFQQVDASDSRQNGGTGLGLAICRSNVEHHGGRIWAWSAPGEGSTFSFLMPAALDEPDGCAPLLRPRAGAVGPRPASVFRVLFVEPDAGTAELLSAIFERYAVETYAATNVREAIEVCPRVLPDLLVLELDLPIADGVEFLDWLRLHERLSALPIVVYTARDLEAAQREHLALSLTTQPLNRDEITPEEFEARVMTLLRPTLATAAKEVGHAPATHPVGR
jgi:CheY-like chemotaxis protein